MKSLDESRNSALGELARSISAQSNFHGDNEFGTLLVTFGDGVSKLSDHQNGFVKYNFSCLKHLLLIYIRLMKYVWGFL